MLTITVSSDILTINWKGEKSMSRNKLYTERIEVCLTKKQKKSLELAAKEWDMTLNEAIRYLISSYC